MSALESNLAVFLFKSTLILVAVLAALFGLRRASAATRHLCLTLAMIALVVLPFLSLGLPAWQLEVLPRSPVTAAPAVAAQKPAQEDAWAENETTAAAAVTRSPSSAGLQQASTVPSSGWKMSLNGWFFLAWAVGAGFVLTKLLAGLLRVRFMMLNGEVVTDPSVLSRLDECGSALGLRLRPLLVSSEWVGVPMVAGWVRPALIVPREFLDWSPDRMRAVMLHELGHLKRHDWPILVLGRLVASFYWFHPLAWYVERCAKRECERACDDLVVTCGTKPSDYATHLLSIARGITGQPESVRAALAVVRRSQLTARLRSILDPVHRRNAPSKTAITGLSTALLLVLIPLASLQFTEKAFAKETEPSPEILLAQHTEMKQRVHEDHDEETSAGKQAYELGYKNHKLGRYEQAAAAFEEAAEGGFRPGASMYNVACCHALMGDAGAAMNWLDRAFEAGFDDPENLVSDSDFNPIRSDAAFQTYIDRAFATAGSEREYPEHYPYRAAMDAFDELQEQSSTDGKKWHKVGYELIGMRELDRAAEAFERSVECSGENNSTAMYNLACALSLAGRTREALDWLDRSVEAGFDQHERFLNDPDLNNIREQKEFERIADKSEFLSLGRFPSRDWDKSNYSETRWAPAVAAYEGYVREHPASGRAWFNLAYALHYSSRHDEAVDAFQKAVDLNFRPTTATYNIACAYAMLGRTEAALDALETAVASGHFHYGQLAGDDDLDSLRDDPRFQAMLEELEKKDHEYEKQMQMKKMKMKMKMKTKHKAEWSSYEKAEQAYLEAKDN